MWLHGQIHPFGLAAPGTHRVAFVRVAHVIQVAHLQFIHKWNAKSVCLRCPEISWDGAEATWDHTGKARLCGTFPCAILQVPEEAIRLAWRPWGFKNISEFQASFSLLENFTLSPQRWGLITFEAENVGSSACAAIEGLPRKVEPTVALQQICDGQHHFRAAAGEEEPKQLGLWPCL